MIKASSLLSQLLPLSYLLISAVTSTCHEPASGGISYRNDDNLHLATTLACEMLGGTYGPYKERRFSWYDGRNCWNYKFYLYDGGSATFDTYACRNWLTTELNGCNQGGENKGFDENNKQWLYDVFGTQGECQNPYPNEALVTSIIKQIDLALPTAVPSCKS